MQGLLVVLRVLLYFFSNFIGISIYDMVVYMDLLLYPSHSYIGVGMF